MTEKPSVDSKEELPQCKDGIHTYPNQEFEIGPRICDACGAKEY